MDEILKYLPPLVRWVATRDGGWSKKIKMRTFGDNTISFIIYCRWRVIGRSQRGSRRVPGRDAAVPPSRLSARLTARRAIYERGSADPI